MPGTNENKAKIIVIAHIFYDDGWDVIYPLLKELKQFEIKLLVNICDVNRKKQELRNQRKNAFADAIVIATPNVGKDIGGKLALMELAIQLKIKADYYIFLHDKKSPHTTLGDRWREKLFRIIQKESASQIHTLFLKNKKVGMVGMKGMITNEYNIKTQDFNSNNSTILKELITEYKIEISNYDFIGGTMFWVRTESFNTFFSKYSPLEIRATLEQGNVLDYTQGTVTHAWERVLSFIITNEKYELRGI